MDSEQKEKPRQQFNVEENRAHSTQGERKVYSDPTTTSFTKDEVENGDLIGKMMVPKKGILSDLSIFVEEMNMNDAKIELQITPANIQKADRVYRKAVSEGFNEFEDIEVFKGDRVAVYLRDLQETIIRGIWVAFTYKQGG